LHLRKALLDERTQWLLRIRSVLYHHGISGGAPARIARGDGRRFLARLDLPEDARERVTVALFMISTLERQIHEIERGLRKIARRQPGRQALMTQFGVGELIALTFLAELGDATRMSSSRKAIRFAGLDIGVHRSDHTARVGKLTRQRSSPSRWAPYEAAQSATRPRSPDHAHYHALRASGMTHTRASLTIARKIARRSYHPLNNLGPDAPAPVTTRHGPRAPASPPHSHRYGPSGQLPQLPRHPPPVAAPTNTERPGTPHGMTDQPSRPEHTTTPRCSRTQISPGTHGARTRTEALTPTNRSDKRQ
jgi:hypothetical protein